MNSTRLLRLVDSELANISQPELVNVIYDHLQSEPDARPVDWDYGEPGEKYECWFVCEDARSNTAIVYCEQGFGPSDPWGLIFVEGPYASMGMDSQWFVSLEDAVRNAPFWVGENPTGYEIP